MGLFDELKKLTRPYSGDEYDDFGDEIPETPTETRQPAAETQRRYSPPVQDRRNPFAPEYESRSPQPAPRRDKLVSINTQSAPPQVVLFKPERFETAAEIADHLRSQHTVVMNLEQTNKDTGRRLIDFLSGVAYALDGKIKRVAANTFILTPHNVDIMGDLIDELGGGDFSSGLYM